ncbi:hypothetical protein CEP52_001452 [Fusarium oligoseptatum]|uniref:Calcineurin-like phosphoesterase domain-containing protein n=1 Tax=Fusarium oligoseptatum TaxID=2604345 RepID=A0A428UJ87_9HYPO|nr:hypothetical protein CEP52_001452 [Fusarium oligoseptatum]
MSPLIKTRFLILSDTHGLQFQEDRKLHESADVAIHCGDLTGDSKLHDFKQAIELLKEIDAPLKIVIAGNHDFTLDDLAFEQKITEASRLAQEDLEDSIKTEYGDYGDARRLLHEARDQGIVFLEEGSHQFTLDNGALLKVYASPYTPTTGNSSDWGFQYNGAHEFDIEKGTDIVKGSESDALNSLLPSPEPNPNFTVLDTFTIVGVQNWLPGDRQYLTDLHIFSDIDNGKSVVIESLSRLKGSKFESAEDREAREDTVERYKSQRCCRTSHCDGDDRPLDSRETLFVNAAVMGDDELSQYPWLVDIELEPYQGKS